MILLDSNIIIYAASFGSESLVSQLGQYDLQVSAITKLETLGYHLLSEEAQDSLTQFFGSVKIVPVDDTILERAIQLRRQKRMSVADSLIAATALSCSLTLWTNNTKDFRHIEEIDLFNPIS